MRNMNVENMKKIIAANRGIITATLAIVLVISTALWIVSLIVFLPRHLQAWDAYEQEWIRRIGSGPDFETWYTWGGGGIFVILPILISLGWAVIIISTIKSFRAKKKGKMRTLLATTLLIVMLVMQSAIFAIPIHATNPTFHILFAGDEEFINGGQWVFLPLPHWVPQTKTAEKAFETVAERFHDQLGYDLIFHGWLMWDSEDTVPFSGDAWEMMVEAIQELNWEVGYDFDGYDMDMLVALTDQSMDNPEHGLAFVWSQAVIVEYPGDPVRTADFIMHELGHVWTLEHCGVFDCVMNPTAALLSLTHGYCTSCNNIVLMNRRHVLVLSDNDAQGDTDPAPGLYTYNLGTTVTIEAKPHAHYDFSHWRTLEGRYITCTNPITTTINSGQSFVAHFRYASSNPSGGGGGGGGGRHSKR
jgi:hypothetical protein